MKKTRTKNKVYRIIMIAFFIALAAIILLPFWAIFIGTFQEGSMLIRYGLNLTLDFSTANFDNYIMLFTESGSYFRWFFCLSGD